MSLAPYTLPVGGRLALYVCTYVTHRHGVRVAGVRMATAMVIINPGWGEKSGGVTLQHLRAATAGDLNIKGPTKLQ